MEAMDMPIQEMSEYIKWNLQIVALKKKLDWAML